MHRTLRVEFDEKKIDALFTKLDSSQRPGAAVGIALRGRPLYRKGFGIANIELPVALSPSIRMRIGSTSKHFTCLAYLLLCEEGKAGVDDPVGRFLPDLPEIARRVTVRQLMANVSGLRDALDLIWQFSNEGKPVSSEETLSYYRDITDVNFQPGTSWCYCNGGFVLLTAIVERVAQRPLEEVLRERIFEPTGMYDSQLRRWNTDFLSNSAAMHSMSANGAYEKAYARTPMSGEGGIVSSVDDMLRWLAHMTEPHVGSPASWAMMKAPHMLPNGTSTGYGFGLMSSRYRGADVLHHAGSVTGGNSQMLKVPGAELDIVVMLNRRDIWGMRLTEAILDACLPELAKVEGPPDPVMAEGIFRSPDTGRVIELQPSSAGLSWTPEGLQIAVIDGCSVALAPDNHGVLWPTGMYDFVKVGLRLVGDRRKPTAILCNDFGNCDELLAVVPAREHEADAVIGHYRSHSTGVDARILQTRDGVRLSTTNRFGTTEYRLECLAQNIWKATSLGEIPWGGILSFDREQSLFSFSSAQRTRLLPFQRLRGK